jgi:ABC-type lipopolysaccharide export system ATPase subunit
MDGKVIDFFWPNATGKHVMFYVVLGHPNRGGLGLTR